MKETIGNNDNGGSAFRLYAFAGCAGAPAQEDSAAQETPGKAWYHSDLAGSGAGKYADDLDRDYTDAINGIGRAIPSRFKFHLIRKRSV